MIVVRRTYIPKPGQGGALLARVRDASAAIKEAGYKPPTIYRGWHGDHGALFTEQPWDSIAEYESSRAAVRQNESITSVFSEIYPLLAKTHNTEILEQVE